MISTHSMAMVLPMLLGPGIPPEITTTAPAGQTGFPLRSYERLSGPEADGAVLTVGPRGSFDSAWIGTPEVHFDGKLYRMWYAGSTTLPGYRGEPCAIGLATSTDGLRWQRANGGRPVLGPGTPGAFDDAQLMGQCILHEGTIWRMWYGGLPKPRGETKWEARQRIGLATSHDGIRWERANRGEPVLDLGPAGSTDDLQVMHPAILRESSGYRMWYAASSASLPHTIAGATSADGVRWTKRDQGAFVRGLGHYVTGPAIYARNGEYLLLYSREDLEVNYWYVGAAVSLDGVQWKLLNQGRPVADPGPRAPRKGTRRAEEGSCFHPSAMVEDGQSLRFWYVENFAEGPGGYRIAAGRLNFRR